MSAYSFQTFDCFGDIPVCLEIYFCGLCCIPFIAGKIGASDTHGCCGVIKAICATEFWMCGLCCCPESILPCFLSSLLKKSMDHHKITTFPAPCGDSQCCNCYWQVCLPCTSLCTLCVIMREANKV